MAVAAAVFHILNQATCKAALFMSAGIVDHETGTRDIRRPGGLIHVMPITATLAHRSGVHGGPDRAQRISFKGVDAGKGVSAVLSPPFADIRNR